MATPLRYQLLQPDQEPPWDLLLHADASKSAVETYLWKGDCFLAYRSKRLVGEFVLLKTRSRVFEIMNIAVDKNLQGKGIGSKLLAKAKRVAQEKGGRTLEVGTGNSSFRQLAFYQRAGFRITGVRPDFFAGRYKKTYRTNGVKLQDMVRLSMSLR